MSRTTPVTSRHGGQILVDQLRIHGVEHLFVVPGESHLPVLDGLLEAGIEVTVCRQEGGAAMMAEAYGKLTGRPGVCLVTRAPGATNAYAGVHVAAQDSTPMILLVGQIDQAVRDREAFQEMDYRAVFGSQAKWASEIDRIERIPEYLSRAFHAASSGRPGPVVLALPEDVLFPTAEVADARPYAVPRTAPTAEQQSELVRLLQAAQRPIAILGGSRWDKASARAFADFAERAALPVVLQFRRQGLLPAAHPCHAGVTGLGADPKVRQAVLDADLVLLVGGRMSEVPSQNYSLLRIPVPQQKLVHVHPDLDELNRVYQADLAIACAPSDWMGALAGLDLGQPSTERRARCAKLHQASLDWHNPTGIDNPGPLQMAPLVQQMRDMLPTDAIIANGAGNFATWVHRFFAYGGLDTQLAPTSGSMGYGVPAAVAAKRVHPQRTVLCWTGDGSFMMHGQEFATAVQYDLALVVVVIDNGVYGTIRMHQEQHYPGRVSATTLRNPDFAAYARAFGGHGERVEKTEEFGPALQRALDSGLPAIVHCLLDPEAISPTTTLSQLRAES